MCERRSCYFTQSTTEESIVHHTPTSLLTHLKSTLESPSRGHAGRDGSGATDSESVTNSAAPDDAFIDERSEKIIPHRAVEFDSYDPFLLEAKRVLRQKCSCEASLAFFFENAFSPSVKSSNLASVDVSNVSHDAYTKRDTYISLANKIALVARFMQKKLGICSGDTVGILSTNSVEVLILHYACALLRTPLLNLNTHLVSHELYHILNDSAAVTVFARESMHGKTLRDALKMQETKSCATKSVVWLPQENMTGAGTSGNPHDMLHLKTKLVTSGSDNHLTNIIQFEWHDEVWYQGWNRSTLKSKNMQVSDFCFSDLSTTIAAVADNPAHVYYTSGTTGAPKGVALSQTIVHKHTVAITLSLIHI